MTIAPAPMLDTSASIGETCDKLGAYDAHTNKVQALEAALIAGEQSGKPYPINFAAFKARMRADHERAHAN